ncbi:MAG: hypothetical protein ACRCXB_32395 [Aeromonadaceae bacterium]
MNNTVRFLQVLTDSNLSWFSFSLGTNFPIMRETKTYWIINTLGDIEKKVMKSTFRLAGCKDSPLFGVYEPQPETLETSTPSRFEHLVDLQSRFPFNPNNRGLLHDDPSSLDALNDLSFDDALLAGGGDNDTLPIVTTPIPVRRRGRPKTGKALSPAEKQARYRARQAEKTVTVTFNRAHLSTLKTLLANAPQSLGLPADELDSLAKAVFDAALK